jgi:hypothetical protein
LDAQFSSVQYEHGLVNRSARKVKRTAKLTVAAAQGLSELAILQGM